MLLHRYHNIEFVMNLDIETGLELIDEAKKQVKEERLFQQWVAQLPVMALSDTYMGFSEYKDNVTGANIDLRPTAEILAELDEIEEKMERRDDNGNGDF